MIPTPSDTFSDRSRQDLSNAAPFSELAPDYLLSFENRSGGLLHILLWDCGGNCSLPSECASRPSHRSTERRNSVYVCSRQGFADLLLLAIRSHGTRRVRTCPVCYRCICGIYMTLCMRWRENTYHKKIASSSDSQEGVCAGSAHAPRSPVS